MGDANDGGLRPGRCGTCRYWDQEEFVTPEDQGICRRHAPAAVAGDPDDPDRYEQFPRWPLTLASEWCGEWAAVPDAGVSGPTPVGPGTPVRDLGLSVRAVKCMARLGIDTLGALTRRTADELRKDRGFGATTLAEVREQLARHGYALRGERVVPPGT